MISSRLQSKGIGFVEVHGEVSSKDKFANVESFNSDPTIRVFVGSPAAAGIGLNIIVSDISIWYSRNFSLEQDIQAEGRNYRGGSEIHEKITRIDMVTPGTMDEVIIENIANKYDISKNILSLKNHLTGLQDP